MKKVSIFLLGFLTVLSVHAQQRTSDVSIVVNGSKNLQISIDERNSNSFNNRQQVDKTTVSMDNLETGIHTLLVVRTNQNNNRTERITATFNLRYTYDMLIRVNKNGSLELIETKSNGSVNNHVAMSDVNFNVLLRNVRYQSNTARKNATITNAFNNGNNYFSTAQVSQLLQLINGESYRIQLAKLSYPVITDPGNFDDLYYLISSQTGRNNLEDFVSNYNEDEDTNTAMSDANFNILYQNIKRQWPVNNQITSLTNAFNNTANYFSSNQASQLIQIASSESNRLQLAKLSYRNITDPENFNQVVNLIYSQSGKNELNAYVNNNGNPGNNPNTAMSDTNFMNLYQDIKRQWPDNNQMSSLTTAFNNTGNYFSSYQASQLIQITNGENNRLQLAKISYRTITDPGNFNQVVNLISSQQGKNELNAYVNNNYSTGNSPNVAMTDARFAVLVQGIERQYLPFEQMNSLTEVFNNTNNYFSSAQVQQLIPMVSAEGNRLQLAKLSYRSVTDRDNFNQLYVLLESQSSKNELDAYVKAYREQ